MLLVFGGTTEGRKAISILNEMQLPFVYSTKTRIEISTGELGDYRSGPFSEEALRTYIKKENIKLILHAAHPFATQLSNIIENVATSMSVPVIRWERNRTDFEGKENCTVIEGYNQAMKILNQRGRNHLLALTGVQSIEKLRPFWETKPTFFRILDRPESKRIAAESDFPEAYLILGYPSKSIDEERALMQSKNIDAVLTKDSGASGALDVKIAACVQEGTPLFILKRPDTPSSFIQVTSESGCRYEISKHVQLWG